MSKQTDQYLALDLRGVTGVSPTLVPAAGARAAEAAKRFGQRIDTASESDGRIEYKVKGPGGLITQASFALVWAPSPSGGSVVSIEWGNYLTAKQSMLLPKTVPALKPAQSFVDSLRSDLSLV